jgi:NAD(P)-dependent dehydrogenase (short-subunit alcohol dehydrogenase family)
VSKTPLRELADALRAEEAPYGLRVMTIYPGGAVTAAGVDRPLGRGLAAPRSTPVRRDLDRPAAGALQRSGHRDDLDFDQPVVGEGLGDDRAGGHRAAEGGVPSPGVLLGVGHVA